MAGRREGGCERAHMLSPLKQGTKKRIVILYTPAGTISVFFMFFLRPTSDVDISETVCPNDLKFDVRIVLYKVPLLIEFQVIRSNRFRDIELGSLPKKTLKYL